jgi:hypothetical protein
VALLAILLTYGNARAEDGNGRAVVDEAWMEADHRVTVAEYPFAFVTDPSTPRRGVVSIGYGFGLGSGVAADRPIPVSLGSAGPTNELSLSYGVTGWFAPSATVSASAGGTTALVGAKFQLTPPDATWRAAFLGGVIREGLGGAFGGWLRACGSWGEGPLLVAANLHVEKIFSAERDQVDVVVMAGASYRIVNGLRLGMEYVGQDLEETAAGTAAEGGPRHAAGPDIALDLDRGRYQLTVATVFGLSAQSPQMLVRAGLVGSF